MTSMENVKFIMRTTGDFDLSEYFAAIPGLQVCCDIDHSAMHTFRDALKKVGDAPCVLMEDDIILCNGFYEKVMAEIEKRPDDIIQFFSMRKDDLTVGSRYIPGYLFKMNQCHYTPKGMALELLEFMPGWVDANPGMVGGVDLLMADYFKMKKLKYWNVCPNLVDHKQVKSRIDPRRSTKRQSFTFVK